MGAATHPRQAARRGPYRPTTWWGRAFLRAVEEAAYDDGQLAAARSLARSGRIGGLVLDAGSVAAGVEDDRGLWTVSGAVPVLDPEAVRAFLEVVSVDHDRLDALLCGDLPHDLVEHAEEAGVELVPYGGELAAVCSCAHWHDVCVHALAVLHQLCALVDRDALVLLQLRGISREDLLARLRTARLPTEAPAAAEVSDDVEVAVDAALRARRLLSEDEAPRAPSG
jgi:uncharacterized Zn finger protein